MSFAGDKISRLAKRAENAYYQRDLEELKLVCKTYEEEVAFLRSRLQQLVEMLNAADPTNN